MCVCVFSLDRPVYMEGFIVAASNLPGNIFTILVMDSTGGKALLCEWIHPEGDFGCLQLIDQLIGAPSFVVS